MSDVNDRLDRIEQQLDKFNDEIKEVGTKLGELAGESRTMKMLLQYVVTPLIVILGALVGVKIVMPT